jgi:hypothetical protein
VVLSVFIVVVIIDSILIDNNSDKISQDTAVVKNNTKAVEQIVQNEQKIISQNNHQTNK